MNSEKNVLIVDDEIENIQIVVSLLRHENYSISYASSGYEALDTLEMANFDMILLDIMMPEIDGIKTCQKIKENPAFCKIPIIFLTASSDFNMLKEAFRCGGVDYISKPFHSEELIARITTHINLYNYQTSLEKRVEEELEKREVERKFLIQQSKMASIGEMFASVAHQWRQPLNEINSIVANIDMDYNYNIITSDSLEMQLKNIEDLTKYLSSTIDNFEQFMHPSNQKFKFALEDVIEQSLSLIKHSFKEIGVEYEVEIFDDIVIYGSPNEYMQVVIAILNNAVEVFTKRGVKNPKIKITVESEKRKSLVEIIDNGGGTPKDLKIFNAYISTKDDDDKSSGLGLYMAKTIIENMDGEIRVRNSEDGAVFSIIM